jgi:hypothetical protein
MPLTYKPNLGTGIMFLFSVIGFIISLFNFFLASSPIRYTGGAELVILTTLTIAILSALADFFRRARARWERLVYYTFIMVLLLGTLFASYLLESWLLLTVMLVVFVGWLMQVFTRQVDNAQSS